MRRFAAALAVLAFAGAARADAGDDYFTRLAAAAKQSLAQVIAQRAPVLVPPVAFVPSWKVVRLGSLDLGAPLVALTAADLDRDGRAELYAVTTKEVVVLAMHKKLAELARVPFLGEPANPRSRDPIGTAVVDGGEVVASSSAWDAELRVSRAGGQWTGRAGLTGPVLPCAGERLSRVPGRDHYGDVAQPVFGVRCAELVDAIGAPLHVRAAQTEKKLEVTVERCAPNRGSAGCLPIAKYDFKDYGAEFEVADVDRDGKPELIVTGSGPPGDKDAVKVFTLGADDKRAMFRKSFNGGIAAIAIGDGDGDGKPEVIVASRLPGSTSIDLWRLD